MDRWLLLGISLAVLMGAPLHADAEAGSVVAKDRTRIQEHLRGVEAYLRAQDTSHLSETQRALRTENIERLHAYWVAGVFPHNTLTDYPSPIFVDPDGRACAVGYLMLEAGYGDAVDEIVRAQNLAYVETIESAGVGAWLEESGITPQEAAWIQPNYAPCNDDCDCEPSPVCAEDGTTYVSPCFAEDCARQIEYEPGCCRGVTRIAWSGDLVSAFTAHARLCPQDPNEVIEDLCETVVAPPNTSDACAASTGIDQSRWLAVLGLLSLIALRRRTRA